MVSPRAVTLVPVRQDLRPVILRGFAVHGKPIVLVKQILDLASCVRLCSRTAECKIVSFNQYDHGQHKICKLFSNMTDNELRRKGQATVSDFTGFIQISVIEHHVSEAFSILGYW